MMKIFIFELRKLLESRAVWSFLAVCLCLNGVIIISNAAGYSYSDHVAAYADKNGVVISEQSNPAISAGDEQYFTAMLKNDLESAYDPYPEYDTDYVGEAYIGALKLDDNGIYARLMRQKYDRLQQSVDELAGTDSPLTIYFASETQNMHSFIFGTLMSFLSMEGSIAAALMAMLSLAMEKNASTETLVYSSRKGRALYLYKLAAAMAMSITAFAVLSVATIALAFIALPIAPIMGSSVSSVFNYINDYIAGLRQFVTWSDVTVFQYMLSTLGVSSLLVLCSAMFGFVAQMFCRNTYIAFGVLMILALMPMFGISVLPSGNAVYFALYMSPVMLWLNHEAWFTDGGGGALLAHFELAGMLLSLLIAMICAAISIIRAKRSDILCEE